MGQGVRKASGLGFARPVSSEEEAREDVDTARVVTRVQAGDHGAFAALYERYFDRVYGYLLVVLGDQREAEDAAQHVFLKALEAMPSYRHRGKPFRAWLFRIARNHAIDQMRRLERVRPTDPSELREWQEARAEGEEGLGVLDLVSDSELMLFVERLPAPQRQALLLRYTADLSSAQIAKVLDRTPADVRMLQSRALRFLRSRLNALGRRTEHAGEDGEKIRMRRMPKEAPVLRSRRWSLHR
jgi:RNA polymerase sigma-70 factor (ECF subfamily)